MVNIPFVGANPIYLSQVYPTFALKFMSYGLFLQIHFVKGKSICFILFLRKVDMCRMLIGCNMGCTRNGRNSVVNFGFLTVELQVLIIF